MKDFMSTHGLIHQTIGPYTPQQNAVAERNNRTFLRSPVPLCLRLKFPLSFGLKLLLLQPISQIVFPQKVFISKPHWKLYKITTLFPPLFFYALVYLVVLSMFIFIPYPT